MLNDIKIEENLVDTDKLLEDISPKTNKLDDWKFGALICMLLEEYCKANNMDVVEEGQKIADTIRDVNETYGRY